ncbi:MAG: hypothetical protein LBC59_09600 [Chitinispirillales bacterium]|jgi:hypothetical protein|nr:hypothetical protein [Chitinispirillales bacterium]
MVTADELQRQKESLTPQIKARLATLEAERRADREREEARTARRAAELRDNELNRHRAPFSVSKHPIPAGYVATGNRPRSYPIPPGYVAVNNNNQN